jgi:hypothetical protein
MGHSVPIRPTATGREQLPMAVEQAPLWPPGPEREASILLEALVNCLVFLFRKHQHLNEKANEKSNHQLLDSTAPRKYIHGPKSNRQGSRTHMVASLHTLRELYQIGVSVSKSDVNSGARHSAVGSLQQSLCHEFAFPGNRLRFCASLCVLPRSCHCAGGWQHC